MGNRARILSDRKGGVAVLFGVVLVPIMGLAALVVDYTHVESARRNAQSAADAAVLATLAPSADATKRNQIARTTFEAQLSDSYKLSFVDFKLTVTEDAEGAIHSTLAYRVRMPLMFAGAVGKETIEFDGNAVAVAGHNSHIDVHFWLDDSASMGVAATEADRDRLRQISQSDPEHRNCAFSCHLPTRMAQGRWTNTLDRARGMGIKIRLDVMLDSVKSVVETLAAEAGPRQQIRFKVESMSRRFRNVTPLTDRSDTVLRRLQTFRPTGTNHGESASRLSETIASGQRQLPQWRGQGTRTRPRQFVVLATDGMQFDWNNMRPGPIDPAACDAIKAQGVTVAVVQLRYVALNGDGAFNTWVRPYFHQLGPALEACATPGYYFSGDTPEQIRDAFKQLALRLTNDLRLTQ